MPGVLIVEAMAQCCAVLALREIDDRERKLFLFGGIDKARFRRPVVPCDQLVEAVALDDALAARRRALDTHSGHVVVAEAEMLSVMTERPQ